MKLEMNMPVALARSIFVLCVVWCTTSMAGNVVCVDPLVFRGAFETPPVCDVNDEPLSTLRTLLEPADPVMSCIPPGTDSGVDYCQGTCSLGGNGCDVELTTSDVFINVSDDLICFDANIFLPGLDINAFGVFSCTVELDIVGNSMADLDGSYSAPFTWQYGSTVSSFVVEDIVADNGCDGIPGGIGALLAQLTPELETQGAVATDALLASLAGTNFCPVDSLHPDFIGNP